MKKQICDRLLADNHITVKEYAILLDIDDDTIFQWNDNKPVPIIYNEAK